VNGRYKLESLIEEFDAPANFLKKVTLREGQELTSVPHRAKSDTATEDLDSGDDSDNDYDVERNDQRDEDFDTSDHEDNAEDEQVSITPKLKRKIIPKKNYTPELRVKRKRANDSSDQVDADKRPTKRRR